jgi:hypothetical protein
MKLMKISKKERKEGEEEVILYHPAPIFIHR